MIKYQLKTLPNGIRLVTAPFTTSEAVTILILVGVGGRFEKKEQRGISHFLEHLFFKGTKKRPSPYELAKELDGLGAYYNAFTTEEYTGFYIQSDARDFDKSFDLISDLFLNPIFPEEEVEKEKGVILEEANMRRDVPQLYVQMLAQKQMFPNSLLGEDLIGTPETIKKITRADIIEYFKNSYCPDQTIIAIAGNPKKYNWEKEVERVFNSSGSGKLKFEKISQKQVKKEIVYEGREVDQIHLILSALAFPKTDPRRYALHILSTILGGGMSSRLFSEIREKRALAYYVKSGIDAYFDTGLIVFSAGVKSDKFQDAVKIIMEQIEDLKKNGPKADELQRAKQNIRGHLALALEDSFEIASYFAEQIYYENRIYQTEETIKNLEKVSAAQVKKVAQDIFQKNRMGLAAVGPKKYSKKLQGKSLEILV